MKGRLSHSLMRSLVSCLDAGFAQVGRVRTIVPFVGPFHDIVYGMYGIALN